MSKSAATISFGGGWSGRTAFRLGQAAVVHGMLACAVWLSPTDARADGALAAQNLPIADVHFHLMLFMTPQELRERMEKNKVRWVVSAGAIGGTPLGSPAARDNDARKHLGASFIPAAGGSEIYLTEKNEGTAFYTDAQSPRREVVLKQIEEQLKAGPRVLVETYPNAESTSVDPLRRRRLATDAPFFREALALAVRHDIPLPMHMQWHPESVAQLGALLSEFPQGRVLLSHCGSVSSAEEIRKFFTRFPNVYCDLGFRGMPQLANDRLRDQGRVVYWPDGAYGKAGMQADWLKVVEDYPDRFMLAVDDVHSWQQYDAVVESLRTGVLARLTPASAEKVAYKNALKLFRLPAEEAAPAVAKPS